MKRLSTSLVGFAAAAALAALPLSAQSFETLSDDVREYVSVPEPTVALVNVRVVDGTGAPPAENQTIVIDGDRKSVV